MLSPLTTNLLSPSFHPFYEDAFPKLLPRRAQLEGQADTSLPTWHSHVYERVEVQPQSPTGRSLPAEVGVTQCKCTPGQASAGGHLGAQPREQGGMQSCGTPGTAPGLMSPLWVLQGTGGKALRRSTAPLDSLVGLSPQHGSLGQWGASG